MKKADRPEEDRVKLIGGIVRYTVLQCVLRPVILYRCWFVSIKMPEVFLICPKERKKERKKVYHLNNNKNNNIFNDCIPLKHPPAQILRIE